MTGTVFVLMMLGSLGLAVILAPRQRPHYPLRDKVVVITGAGSGIGRALAQELDHKGCRLALSDVDERSLAETAATLSRPPHLKRLDVANREEFHAYANSVETDLGGVHVVINNAGVGVSQTVANLRYEDFEWLMGINFWGVVHGTKAFLPLMLARDEGRIVNISSMFGLVAVPTQSAYNSAKFAVRGFTEALRHELRGSGVRAISVHPGGIKTAILANSRFYVDLNGGSDHQAAADGFQRLARTAPQKAALAIIDGIERGCERVLVGQDAKLVSLIQRLAPESYWALLGRLMNMAR